MQIKKKKESCKNRALQQKICPFYFVKALGDLHLLTPFLYLQVLRPSQLFDTTHETVHYVVAKWTYCTNDYTAHYFKGFFATDATD